MVLSYLTRMTHNFRSTPGANDWSWRVRYSALSNLVRICQYLLGDDEKIGLRLLAWRTLLKARSVEKDPRVLQALTVGEVHWLFLMNRTADNKIT